MLKPLQYWHSLDRVTPDKWKELIVEAAMMSSSFITKLRGKKKVIFCMSESFTTAFCL